MGLFFGPSAKTKAEAERARRSCATKSTALHQCVHINGVSACARLASDFDFCRASRVSACEKAADAFDKCTKKNINWTGLPEDAPSCERELKMMRKCLRRNKA
jgi:hypothetical protein